MNNKESKKQLFPILDLKIGDVPIENFVISYDRTIKHPEQYAAYLLQKYITWSCGKTLKIIRGMWYKKEHEIVLGKCEKTNPHYPSDLGPDGVCVRATNGKLYLFGEGTRGTLYAVYTFLEKYLGWQFFTPELETIPQQEKLHLPGEFSYCFSPPFKWRQTDWFNAMDPDFCTKCRFNCISNETWGTTLDRPRYGYGHKYIRGLGPHSFMQLISKTEYLDKPEYFAKEENGELVPPTFGGQDEPCLTHPDVFDIVVKKVDALLRDQYSQTEFDESFLVVPITQNDNVNNYCRCKRCKAEGTPTDLYLKFVIKVAKYFEEKYPNVLFEMLAYRYTELPPSSDISIPSNVRIRLCPIQRCFAHDLNDKSCTGTRAYPKANQLFLEHLKGWNERTTGLSVWDYTTNFHFFLSPFADFDVVRKNMKIYLNNGVEGVFLQGNNQPGNGEFGELRAYLFGKLLWNPTMSKQEYYGYMDSFLNAYYGPAAPEIRTYIHLLEKHCNKDNHYSCFCRPELSDRGFNIGMIMNHDPSTFLETAKELWKTAKEKTKNTNYYSRVRKSELSFRFFELCATYQSNKVKRTTRQKKAYENKNERFLSDVIKYRIAWDEGRRLPITYDKKNSPAVWAGL